jgi:GNAT superfamily N-acetyltransferase
MRFDVVGSDDQLVECTKVITESFMTVAREFNLTKENAPTNPAFYTVGSLGNYLKKQTSLFGLYGNGRMVGCIAIEPSKESTGTFYIERMAVLPDERHKGYGLLLLQYAEGKIAEVGGHLAALGIIDKNTVLKEWYLKNGYTITGTREFAHLPFKVCFMEKRLSTGPDRR